MSGDARRYLGDGVYVEIERGMVRLSTSNGIRDTNEVYLEPEVLAAFEHWLSGIRQAARAEAAAGAKS